MNIAVTGANGFIAKNLLLRLKFQKKCKIFKITRSTSKSQLKLILLKSDIIYHFAGVNRPSKIKTFKKDNVGLTKNICDFIIKYNLNKTIVFSSTIQVNNNTDYGASKKKCELYLQKLKKNNKSKVIMLRLPNVYVKWSKPNYNSVVSTFCYNISRNKKIKITNPNKTINLLYIDDLVDELINIKNKKAVKDKIFNKFKFTQQLTAKKLSNIIYNFEKNRNTLFLNDLKSKLAKNLYSTYISFLPKKKFSYKLKSSKDKRGSFTEVLKTNNNGQISVFVAKKNKIRGHHFHNSKVEKFLVLKGRALFKMQNVINKQKVSFNLNSHIPKIVETIPGWQHYIKNIGSEDLVVLLWSNEVFDVKKPDTYQI